MTAPTDRELEELYEMLERAVQSRDVELICKSLDRARELGVFTLDDFRALQIAPQPGAHSHLVQAMTRLMELDPQAADGQCDIAVDRMDGRYGVAEAGWAALVVNAYLMAQDELDGPQTGAADKLRGLKAAHTSIRDIAAFCFMLLHQHAFSPEAQRHKSPDRADFQEVSIGLRKIFRKAGGTLPKEPSE